MARFPDTSFPKVRPEDEFGFRRGRACVERGTEMVMDYDNDLRTCPLERIQASIRKAKRTATRVSKQAHGNPNAEMYEAVSEVARLQAGYIARLEIGTIECERNGEKDRKTRVLCCEHLEDPMVKVGQFYQVWDRSLIVVCEDCHNNHVIRTKKNTQVACLECFLNHLLLGKPSIPVPVEILTLDADV
jgi:hypothetical protein